MYQSDEQVIIAFSPEIRANLLTYSKEELEELARQVNEVNRKHDFQKRSQRSSD